MLGFIVAVVVWYDAEALAACLALLLELSSAIESVGTRPLLQFQNGCCCICIKDRFSSTPAWDYAAQLHVA